MLYKLGANKLWSRIWFWTADPQFSTLRTLSWDSGSKMWICFFFEWDFQIFLCFSDWYDSIFSQNFLQNSQYWTLEKKAHTPWTVNDVAAKHTLKIPQWVFKLCRGLSILKVRPIRRWGSFLVTSLTAHSLGAYKKYNFIKVLKSLFCIVVTTLVICHVYIHDLTLVQQIS